MVRNDVIRGVTIQYRRKHANFELWSKPENRKGDEGLQPENCYKQ